MEAQTPEPEPNDGKDKAGKKAETGKLGPYRSERKKEARGCRKEDDKEAGEVSTKPL
jgi:hypothetical protein